MDSKLSDFMLEVCPAYTGKSTYTTTLLADSGINNRLVKLRSLIDQTWVDYKGEFDCTKVIQCIWVIPLTVALIVVRGFMTNNHGFSHLAVSTTTVFPAYGEPARTMTSGISCQHNRNLLTCFEYINVSQLYFEAVNFLPQYTRTLLMLYSSK